MDLFSCYLYSSDRPSLADANVSRKVFHRVRERLLYLAYASEHPIVNHILVKKDTLQWFKLHGWLSSILFALGRQMSLSYYGVPSLGVS